MIAIQCVGKYPPYVDNTYGIGFEFQKNEIKMVDDSLAKRLLADFPAIYIKAEVEKPKAAKLEKIVVKKKSKEEEARLNEINKLVQYQKDVDISSVEYLKVLSLNEFQKFFSDDEPVENVRKFLKEQIDLRLRNT